jgi:predicted TIM-barrel fold metal-dependent hydrolase
MAAMAASQLRDIRVIDTDTHMMEAADLWTSRISVKKWGDLVPHVRWDPETQEDSWYFGSERIAGAVKSAMAGWHEWPPNHPKRFADVAPALLDPAARLALMDDYGIWAQVLYPNVAGFGAGRYLGLGDPELMLACVQAYNDYLSEWSAFAPGRFVPVMALPFWDLDATIKEMGRAASNGHRGIVFGSQPELFGVPPLISPHWDRLWAAAQDLELPINFHIASGDNTSRDEANKIEDYMGEVPAYAVSPVLFFLGNARAIVHLIGSGICHRFPKLNFVSVESGIGWLPFVLGALDWQWKNCNVRGVHPEYDLLPSEYFRRQIYGCFWFETDTLSESIRSLGEDNVFYETDFPHPTSMSPGPATVAIRPDDYMKTALKGFDETTIRKVLHDNASRVYHLD